MVIQVWSSSFSLSPSPIRNSLWCARRNRLKGFAHAQEPHTRRGDKLKLELHTPNPSHCVARGNSVEAVKAPMRKSSTRKWLMVNAVKPGTTKSNQLPGWTGWTWQKLTLAGTLSEFKWHRVPAEVSRCQIMSPVATSVHIFRREKIAIEAATNFRRCWTRLWAPWRRFATRPFLFTDIPVYSQANETQYINRRLKL